MDVLGRDSELARIDAWLDGAAAGDQAAAETVPPLLVIEGAPGIGKTTLWAEAVARARALGWQVLTCRLVPSDAGLPHVALADLLGPVAEQAFGGLPPPQRRALRVALLHEEAGEGDLDPRAVGSGLAGLLAALAEAGPLLLAADDAQWLDAASARALAFALRRLGDRQVAVIAAIRIEEPSASRGGTFTAIESSLTGEGSQNLEVGPLSVASIHQILRQKLGSSFPRPLLVSIHRAAGGNPFYALEIARELRRIGNPPPGQPLPVPEDNRELALLRMRRLPRATRGVLARLAAMPGAAAADVDLDALAPAERAGIATVRASGRVEFTHPLFGSALYTSLPEAERRALHRELAATAGSAQERARHLAIAAEGPDQRTAAELDNAALAARARGAADVAVELKELACQLTPRDDDAVVRRMTELAEFRYFAGDPSGARRELEGLVTILASGDERAQVLLELGSMRWVQGEAEPGRELMTQALREARTPHLLARIHARIASGADDADVTVEHGEAALALLDEQEDPQLYSFVLLILTLFKLHAGQGADHASIEKGLRLQREAVGWDVSPAPAFWARNFDDFDTARTRLEGLITVIREQGEDAQLAGALTHLSMIEALTGRMPRARALAEEALDLAGQTEQETYLDVARGAMAYVYACAGDVAEARATATELLARLAVTPDPVLEVPAREALGLAALTAGELTEADRHLTRADEINELIHNREPANRRFHADHAEAVIGLGDLDRAERLVARMEARATALPRPWILAVSARSRGLLHAARGNLDAALADYQRALAAHQNLDMPAELGRTLLALGRLHRRRGERQLAQECLERAVTELDSAGALVWATTAREELSRARGRRGSPDELTPTEQTICELAATGLRNHEIAARLFLSEKTVEANLSRGYRKLGVRSRAELASKLSSSRGPVAQP